ncbi:hypothetical protein MKW92_029431 [Papaver armeniacum]|nr:hypothetical protein MKW92_029431 [Papaver armeniacum]
MVSKERCQCYLGLLLTPCIICLVVWLTIRSSPPGFSIHKFTVPALNQTSSSFNSSRIINATISFEAKLKNENKEKGIYYDALNLTLYYYHENKSSFLPIEIFLCLRFIKVVKKQLHAVTPLRLMEFLGTMLE